MVDQTDKAIPQESATMRRWNVYRLIQRADIGMAVLNELLPNGKPLSYEHELWDYKRDLPTLPVGRKPHDSERKSYKEGMAEIVKDAISFYNTYGGYLIAGITDNPRQVFGFGQLFNCEDLKVKIQFATGHKIDFSYSTREIQTGSSVIPIGILHIPKRPDSIAPAQFIRNADPTDTGYRAYKDKDIYFRQAHECKPAINSDDLEFLFSKGRRYIGGPEDIQPVSTLNHNLGPRDPGVIDFIGREEYLQHLWRWLCDKYNPCKLLTGIGGVGKTTIARAFAEQVVISNPLGFDRLIWVSAKKRFFTASLNSYREASRVDFTDVNSLLRSILLELTYADSDFDEQCPYDELVEKTIEALRAFPSFLVIDDVDSLASDQQNAVFHTILQVTNHAAGASAPSRALFTARLELGAAPGQFLKVIGLEPGEFYDYVKMAANGLGIKWTLPPTHRLMVKFHQVTDGSPTFASSILRLMRLGFQLYKALDDWQGGKGDDVRRFAFERELKVLRPSTIRTLYAASILGETSLIELKQVTEHNDTVLEDDIGELRNYHLIANEGDFSLGGARLIVPSSIRLLISLVREKVKDPRRIEKACGTVQKVVSIQEETVASTLRRTTGLLKEGSASVALDILIAADDKTPDNPNINFLLGTTYLAVNPPDAVRAEEALKRAYELGYSKPELLSQWVRAKELAKDWKGIAKITRLENLSAPPAEKVFHRVEAYYKLAEIADRSSNAETCLKFHDQIISNIIIAFKKRQARGRFNEFNERLRISFQRYIALTDKLTFSPGRHIEVWYATYRAFASRVFRSDFVRLGIDRLTSWWRSVEKQKGFDQRKAAILEMQLSRLEEILQFVQQPNLALPELAQSVQKQKVDLAKKLQTYRARSG